MRFWRSTESSQVNPHLILDDLINDSTSCRDIWDVASMVQGLSYDEFMSNISSHQHVDKIKVPMLAVNSGDDQLCHYKNIPLEQIKANENIVHVRINGGGHISFYSGHLKPKLFGFEMGADFLADFEKKRKWKLASQQSVKRSKTAKKGLDELSQE